MGPIGGGGYTVDRGAPMYRGYVLSRAASHSLAKILDSRIERVGGIDRSPRAGDLELIRIAAHDRAAIDEAVEHERKAAPGEEIRPVKEADMQMRGGGVAGVAELAEFDPLF